MKFRCASCRPLILLEPTDHPMDQRNGIPLDELLGVLTPLMHPR